MHVEVFKVLVLDRIQQRIWSSTLKFQFLRIGGKAVEVFMVLSQYVGFLTDHVILVVCCGKDACLGQFGSGATLGENIVTVGLRSRGVWHSQC